MKLSGFVSKAISLREAAAIIFVLVALLPLLLFVAFLSVSNLISKTEAQFAALMALIIACLGFVVFRRMVDQIAEIELGAFTLYPGSYDDYLAQKAARQEQLEAAKEDLTLREGRVMVRGAPDRSVSYADVIRLSKRTNILGQGTLIAKHGPDGSEVVMDSETGQGYGSAEWHPAVVSCEVEVDVETGRVEVTRLHAELYVGRVINPRLCELQVEGSALFGLGQSLFEELVFDTDGRITNPNLSDYMIPSFNDVPQELTVHLLEPEGVTEVHGIGETALPPIRPAIGNAICRALGVRIFELPITPEKVLRALQKKQG